MDNLIAYKIDRLLSEWYRTRSWFREEPEDCKGGSCAASVGEYGMVIQVLPECYFIWFQLTLLAACGNLNALLDNVVCLVYVSLYISCIFYSFIHAPSSSFHTALMIAIFPKLSTYICPHTLYIYMTLMWCSRCFSQGTRTTDKHQQALEKP